MGNDAEVMRYITSANIACGFHGGDPATIRKTVALAVERGVAIGAQSVASDLQGFGRRVMQIKPQGCTTWSSTRRERSRLSRAQRAPSLHHVKCHGALYNMAATDAAALRGDGESS